MSDPIDFSGSPAEVVAKVYEYSWQRASELSEETTEAFSKAIAEGSNAATMTPASLVSSFNVVEPNVFIPTNAEGASLAKFNELSDAVIDKLVGLFRGYMSEYFPNECGYLTKAQQWICDTLTNGGTGIRPNVEDQIFQRERARTLQEAQRATDETLATFAARGYPLPPGAAAHAVRMVQQGAQAAAAQASRDIAIKQMDIEIENTRFAVDKAIALYSAAVGAAGDYIKAMSIGPQSGMQLIPSITDSQSRLISAASEYYRARIAVRELELKTKLPNAEFDQASRVKNGDWNMQMVANKLQAAIEAARSLSTQAAAALNGLHAQAGISGQGSTSVSYSYGGDVTTEVPPKTVA